MFDILGFNIETDLHMIVFGLLIGVICGRGFLSTKGDIISFISDSILFGAVGALSRYGVSISTLDRLAGWVLLLFAFYCGVKLRHYIKKKTVKHVNTGCNSETSFKAEPHTDNDDISPPQRSKPYDRCDGDIGDGRDLSGVHRLWV